MRPNSPFARRAASSPRPGTAPQSRRPSAAARRTLLALALGTCFLSTHGANAAMTYTGTFPGVSTTNFSAAGLPSGGSGTNDSLIFTTSGTGAATGTDDIAAVLNAMTLTFSNTTGSLTLNQGAGKTINLASGGTVNLNASGGLNDGLNLALAGNATFSQSNAALFSGVISGGTSANTISLNNTVGAASATNALTLTGTNTYAGNWIVNSTGGGANYQNIDLILNNTASTTAAPTILGNLQIGANGNVTGVQMSAANQFSANSVVSFGGTNNYQYFVMHFGQTIGGLNASLAGNSVVEIGGPNDSANPNYGAQTLTLGGSGTYSFNGLIRDHDTGGGTNGGDVLALVMNGTGTQTLTGVNGYSGGTTVNSGTLIATNNGNDLGTGGLTIGSGGTFDYNTTAANKTLTLGAGVLKMTGGGTIGVGLGGTISSTAAANLTGTNTINIYSVPGVAPTTGTQTLLSDAAGGLNGGTLNLGTLYNTSNFTVTPGSLTRNANAVTIGVTSQTALTNEFWKGGFSGGNNVWAISDGTANSNWASNQAGTVTSLTPGSTATVTFSSTGATNQGSTVLGASMNIAGIVVNDASAVGLNADGNTLTLGTGGITDNAGAGAVTLGAAMTLSGAQTWNNLNTNALNPLTVSGNVNAAGNALIIAGTNTATVGTGSTALSGTDTLQNLTVSNGNLVIGAGAAITSSGGWYVGYTPAQNGTSIGTVTQNGGSVTINGTVTGQQGPAGIILGEGLNAVTTTGNYTLNSGTLSLGANTLALADGTYNNNNTSKGTFTQNGGTVTVGTVQVGATYNNQAATGTYNLNGGTLKANGFNINTASGGANTSNLVLNLNGGTVQAGAAFTFAAPAGSKQYQSSIGAGGGTIDTNGFAVTWNAPLTHTGAGTDGGLTINSTTAGGALTLTGTNTYTGATAIGSGATLNLGNGTTGNDGTISNSSGVTDNGNLTYNLFGSQSPAYIIGGSGSLTKSGAGTLTLTKAETYSGATTVNAGNLDVGAGGSLATNAVSVGNGATFSLASGAVNNLAINNATANATALTLNGSILNFDVLGNTADSITLGSGLLASISGSNTIYLTNLAGGITGNNGSYITLISAPGGGLNGGTFTLGAGSTALNGYNLSLNDTGTLLQLLETPNSYTHIYWQGANGPSWSTITGGKTNFTSDAAGTAFTSTVPTAADNIIFTANTATNFANTTLDQAFTVNSLTFSGTGTSNTAGSGIAPGTGGAASTLTINGLNDGYNAAGNGITVQAGSGANTISANVILGGSLAQTWTNNSSNTLAATGTVTAGSNLLTLAGSGATTIANLSTSTGATVSSGAAAETISAATLGGASTFTNNSANTLALGTVTAGANLLTLAGSGATTISNLSTSTGATVSSGAGATTISAATLGGASTFTNSSANTLTLNNVSAGANALTVAGTGTTALTGTDSLAQVQVSTGNVTIGSGAAITSTGGWFVGANGAAGTGTVAQSGGSVNINGTVTGTTITGGLVLGGGNGFTSTGTYSISGGTLTLGATGTDELALSGGDYVGAAGATSTGTFNESGSATGPSATIVSVGLIGIGQAYDGPQATGTYNLNGGLLQTTGFQIVSGGASNSVLNFNFNGGTLQAKNAFAFGPTAGVDIYNSSIGATTGSTIDTNGFAVAWNSALTHTGTPAKDGGLTVTSSVNGGTLTLSNTNTYTGGTTVGGNGKAVTLNLSHAGADGTGRLTVNSGATVNVTVSGADTANDPDIEGGLYTVAANTALGSGTTIAGGGVLRNLGFTNATTANNVQNGGALTIGAGGGTIDFGAGNTGATFNFTSFTDATNATLNITDWTGNFTDGTNGGDGIDLLLFGTALTSQQLSDIVFVNPNGLSGTFSAAQITSDGEVAAAPEPSQVGMMGLMALGLGGLLLRAKKRNAVKSAA